MRRMLALLVGAALALGLAAPGAASRQGREAGDLPEVTGPITTGRGVPSLIGSDFDFASVGYVAEEYFLEGTAVSYAADGELARNGRWDVEEADTAPYTTRIVVYRPESADDFHGTVFVEWLNVSAGFDSAPDWLAGHTELIRTGAAWVGVSAQAIGVQGGAESVSEDVASGGVKAADPPRYAPLSHPGDAFSYDIYTQTGRVAANTGDPRPLGDLEVQRVIAIGESQSAFRMVTYVNAVHPSAEVFDGFLVHSRGASGAGLGESVGRGNDDPEMPEVARIRRDLDVPVLTFQTENDLTRLGSLPARQPDSRRFRLWEVAGSAHADAYTAGLAFGDTDDGDAERMLLDPRNATGGPLGCGAPINAGPAFAVLNAALGQLDRWVRDGTAPPRAPRLDTTDGGDIARDEHGNAEGGIRTPLVDAPVAALTGEPNEGGSFCALFGSTVPFDAATLAELYPTHDDYVRAFEAAAEDAVAAGFLVARDARQFEAAARDLDLGRP